METSSPAPRQVLGPELDALTGEILPERTVLSVATSGMAPPGYVVHDGHGGSVYYACQTTSTPGSQGLIGALGLGYPPSSTTTCMPAAIISH